MMLIDTVANLERAFIILGVDWLSAGRQILACAAVIGWFPFCIIMNIKTDLVFEWLK